MNMFDELSKSLEGFQKECNLTPLQLMQTLSVALLLDGSGDPLSKKLKTSVDRIKNISDGNVKNNVSKLIKDYKVAITADELNELLKGI